MRLSGKTHLCPGRWLARDSQAYANDPSEMLSERRSIHKCSGAVLEPRVPASRICLGPAGAPSQCQRPAPDDCRI